MTAGLKARRRWTSLDFMKEEVPLKRAPVGTMKFVLSWFGWHILSTAARWALAHRCSSP